MLSQKSTVSPEKDTFAATMAGTRTSNYKASARKRNSVRSGGTAADSNNLIGNEDVVGKVDVAEECVIDRNNGISSGTESEKVENLLMQLQQARETLASANQDRMDTTNDIAVASGGIGHTVSTDSVSGGRPETDEIGSEDSTSYKASNNAGSQPANKKKRLTVTKEYEIDKFDHLKIKKLVKVAVFADLKFARDLDLRKFAERIGLHELNFKEQKIEGYLKSIERALVRYTTIRRCAVLRSFRMKYHGTSLNLVWCIGLCHLSRSDTSFPFCRNEAKLRLMKGTSYGLKKVLTTEPETLPSIVLREPYENASEDYKELWRWIVMVILPIVSYKWKARVEAGSRVKKTDNEFWRCVTTGDVAFVFTLLRFGQKKLVDGTELELHNSALANINKKRSAAVTVKLENDIVVTTYAELDETVVVHGNRNSRGSIASSIDSSADDENGDDSDAVADDDGEGEGDGEGDEKCGAPPASGVKKKTTGRKRGEDGFGSKGNIRMFNEYGYMLEELLDEPKKRHMANSWTIQAMKWVNGEVITVDTDDDSDSNEGGGRNAKRARLAPFVPRERFESEY